MSYPIIDAHQHFWKFDPVRDSWITEEMKFYERIICLLMRKLYLIKIILMVL